MSSVPAGLSCDMTETAAASETQGGFEPTGDEILELFQPPPPGTRLNPRTLSPFERALLEIDGTVTRFIEAYTMEPVEVHKLGQGTRTLPADVPLLEVEAGAAVTTRQVLLRGRDSRRLYAYGASLIAPDRMPPQAREALQIPGKGLGRLMRETRMETFREIVWRFREPGRTVPEAMRPLLAFGIVCRTYRVVCGGRPIMLIHEKFPHSSDLPMHH